MEDLIFDRTTSDVNYAKAHPSDANFLKGAYNYTDLNRVESWCQYLATELNAVGYSINITTKTDWTMADFPTRTQMERVRQNIKKIMNGYHYVTNIYAETQNFRYYHANRWEQILNEICWLMVGMQNWYTYSGVARAGQPRLWQNRYRHFYSYPTSVGESQLTTETGDGITTESGEAIDFESVPYTMLDWIESTGTQWIDTGIVNSATIKVETKMSTQGSNSLNGSETSSSSNYRFRFGTGGNGTVYYGYGNNNYSTATKINLTETYTYYMARGEQWVKNSLGTTILNSTDTTLTSYSTNTIKLFAVTQWNSTSIAGLMRIYYCKIYDGDTLVRDFIPVLDETNQTPCLYDKVTETYFYNQGTGSFITPITSHTELNYLQSTGTQFINTGIYPYTTELQLELALTDLTKKDGAIAGCWNDNNNRYYACHYLNNGTLASLNRSGGVITLMSTPDTSKHFLRYNDSNNKIYFDGAEMGTISDLTTTATYPLYLFARRGSSTAETKSYSRIYSAKIIDRANNLVYDFKPVLKDNQPCMFDKVTYRYYYNAGTGTFLYG